MNKFPEISMFSRVVSTLKHGGPMHTAPSARLFRRKNDDGTREWPVDGQA